MDLEGSFSAEEKKALSVLTRRGFKPFTEAKLEDVKELDGTRHRTFRNEGRYDLILALRKVEPQKPLKAEQPVKKAKAKPVAKRKTAAKPAANPRLSASKQTQKRIAKKTNPK